jgi:effector-binding domain-containing protein
VEPIIVHRDAQPYVGHRESITMTEFARIADQLPPMFAVLAEHGVAVTGPPFFRYRVIDMSTELVIDAGIPVAGDPGVELPMFTAELPAGRYAMVSHVGHPDELMGVTAKLLDWAQQQGLEWDMTPTAEGEVWGARLEVLMTDPAEEPDMHKWRTDLYFRLAD